VCRSERIVSTGKTTFLRAGAFSAALADRRAAKVKAATPALASSAAAPPPPAEPPAGATGLAASMKRAVKSVLRPVSLPAMRRVTWSVDRSETSARTVELGVKLDALAMRIEHMAARGEAAQEVLQGLAQAISRAEVDRSGLEEKVGSALAESATRIAALESGLADLARSDTSPPDPAGPYRARFAASDEEPVLASQVARDLKLVADRSLGLIVPLGNGLILARTSIGFLAIDTADAATIAYLAEGRIPEQGSLSLLTRLLKPGDGFIDAGANYGIFSIAGGRAVGPGGRVLAVEPNPPVVRALRTTLHLNGLAERTRVEEVAGGRQDAMATFFKAEISGHSSLWPLDEAAEPIQVKVQRLDALTKPGSRWSVVKLDTEGAELDILHGMERIRADNPDLHVIVEFGPIHIVRQGSSIESWMSAWREAGFSAYEIHASRALVNPIRQTGLEEVGSLNLLMAPRTSKIVGELMRSAE
jgi:FkbM family methyltransferase